MARKLLLRKDCREKVPVMTSQIDAKKIKALKAVQAKEYAKAESAYREVLKVEPRDEDSLLNLGLIFEVTGRIDEYRRHSDMAWDLLPGDSRFRTRAALARYAQSEYNAAYEVMLGHSKDQKLDFEGNMLMCALCAELQKDIESLKYALEAVALRPQSALAHNNLGGGFLSANEYEKAKICFETALLLDERNTQALTNLGVIENRTGDFEKAINYYETALENLKNSPRGTEISRIKFHMSLCQLAIGDLERGWENYYSGFKFIGPTSRQPYRIENVPEWWGEDISEKTILVSKEQGLGDEIHFYSAIAQLEKKAKKIILECDSRLKALMQRSFPNIHVRAFEYISNESGYKSPHNDFDCHVHAGTMFGYFHKTVDSFKDAKPYLKPHPDKIKFYDRRMGSKNGLLRVGVSWRSGLMNVVRNRHYAKLSDWSEIFKIPNLQFINIQYGDVEAEIRSVENAFNVSLNNWTDIDRKDDLDELSAVMANLDVVISPATAVAQMAGALGVKTLWLNLRPDILQFGQLGKYPNYPSVEVIMPSAGGKVSDLLESIVPQRLEVLKYERLIESATHFKN